MKAWIRNAMIVTMKDGEEPYVGDLLIENDRIKAIGAEIPAADTASADKTIQGEGFVAMPGLINAHQHSPMSLLRGFSDDMKLMDWLSRKMLPAESKMTPEDIYWGSLLAIAEMIRSGTTCFADMYIHMDQIAEAVMTSGMRASLTRGLVFLEDDGGRRMQEAIDLVERWSGAGEGRITTMVGPHSPYTCPPEPLKEVVTYAEAAGKPIHIHLAETKEEVEKINERYGLTPTAYLANTGMFERVPVLLAHGVHLTSGDIDLLTGMRGGIAHNPVSNLKLGCGIAPITACMQQGITVGLGTDGAGSATTLDMFAEIKAAAWLQKLDYEDPTALSAVQALRLATSESAKLLQIGHETGTLEAGKKADLILVHMRQPHLQPIHDVHALLAYAASGADVDTVMVDGKLLMQGRKLLTIDEEALYEQVEKRARRIVQGV